MYKNATFVCHRRFESAWCVVTLNIQVALLLLRTLPGDRGDVGLGLAHLVELLGQEVPEDDLQVEAAQVPVVPHAQDLGLGVRLAVATVVGLDLQLQEKGDNSRLAWNQEYLKKEMTMIKFWVWFYVEQDKLLTTDGATFG